MSVAISTKVLPSGARIPVIGFGAYLENDVTNSYNIVLSALKQGYRHIDTAQLYHNEAEVGRAVRDSGIPREEIFVTSKLFLIDWGYKRALDSIKKSNQKIGLGYIDLFLLHAPGDAATRAETWRAVEELHEQGILKDIGVSNFSGAHIDKLMKTAKVKPAVNQIEVHPWLTRPETVKYCQDHDIIVQAYSPLVKGYKMRDSTLIEIANEVNATPAQVLVAFSLARNIIPLPKSANTKRQKENLESTNVKLSAEQLDKLMALDEYYVTDWDPIRDEEV
ncbi:putative oxidoreductase C2F3.05c [Phytophthora nicotianae]|uniref:Oxidoreductase C2F3.05c n=1 Tax=Phytophthora nicotianae TaxID=4792 RepID=A0A0W8DA71_PHYNI|nr:putative oxidoreductase C2F3.05c [Phytophthora nicotianae]KUF93264.1 Potassium voltage-gated channel subfamily A member 4 [Phytophthora nicotianae]